MVATVRRWIAVLLLALCAGAAQAHKPSDAYLTIDVDVTTVRVRWDIALRDLDAAFDLDRNGDRALTWGEVRARFDDIDRYALEHLVLDGGRCRLVMRDHALDHHSDGGYLVLTLDATCRIDGPLAFDYTLFDRFDPTHRGIVRVSFDQGPQRLVVVDPGKGRVELARDAAAAGPHDGSTTDPFAGGFVAAGVHHILIGYDHVLFLVCLLLPAVLTRRSHHREPVVRWTDAARPILVTVTAFTIAHTITLALAALRIVELPPRIIEPAIAATIVFTAIGNLRPSRFRDSAAMPFLFGIVHGFGFADVLHELDLPFGAFVSALLRFNVGVELGQLAIVAITLAPLYVLRRWRGYRRWIVMPISAVAIALASAWFIERALDVKLLPA